MWRIQTVLLLLILSAGPLWGVQLKPIIVIGPSKVEGVNIRFNFEFYRLTAVAMDSQQNLYVLDGGRNCVVRFDRNGKFLRTFGEKSQGPEGLTQPYTIMFNPFNDHIYVLENFGFSLKEFQRNGKFVKKIVLKHQFSTNQGVFLDESHLLMVDPNDNHETPYTTCCVLNLTTGKRERRFDSSDAYPGVNAYQRLAVSGGRFWTCTGDRAQVREYRLSDGKRLHSYPVQCVFQPGYVKEISRNGMRGMVCIVPVKLLPIAIGKKIYVLAILEKRHQGESSVLDLDCDPITNDLYELRDGVFTKVETLKQMEGLFFMAANGNRIVASGELPEPHLVVFEVHE